VGYLFSEKTGHGQFKEKERRLLFKGKQLRLKHVQMSKTSFMNTEAKVGEDKEVGKCMWSVGVWLFEMRKKGEFVSAGHEDGRLFPKVAMPLAGMERILLLINLKWLVKIRRWEI